MQTQVQRVIDEARGRYPKVRLQVRAVIPHQRPHPIAALQSRARQRSRKRPCPRADIAVAGAMKRPVGAARDDLDAPEELAGALRDRGDRERVLHHAAEHSCLAYTRASARAARYSME